MRVEEDEESGRSKINGAVRAETGRGVINRIVADVGPFQALAHAVRMGAAVIRRRRGRRGGSVPGFIDQRAGTVSDALSQSKTQRGKGRLNAEQAEEADAHSRR